MIHLLSVETPEHVEWLRVQRSRPEVYKYFRQDRPLSIDEQRRWWRSLNRTRVKLYIVLNEDNEWIGYVGFNPFSLVSRTAEFGIFVLPEFQGKGYGTLMMKEILRRGFEDHNLSSIYSDVLDYPGENRFAFYEGLGFEAHPPEAQGRGYMKLGKYIPSLKFFMTKDKWFSMKEKDGQNRNGGLGTLSKTAPVKKKRGRPRKIRQNVHSG